MSSPKDSYYKQVRSKPVLKKAWRKVLGNGLTSLSSERREDVKKFAVDADVHIERISRQLRESRFKFLPAKGIRQKKKGKKGFRSIVIAPIQNRIVQRSILEVLQSQPEVNSCITVPSSFGGIPNRGVEHAIQAVLTAIKQGATWYIRSDIEAFFTRIPKNIVLDKVAAWVNEMEFVDLLRRAIEVELENYEVLKEYAHEFPLYNEGVAQGCCLSSLLGNILLNDFDKELNQRGIVCIRYVDDFVILAESKQAALKAFTQGKSILQQYNLNVYSPVENPEKAQIDQIDNGMDFLGCSIEKAVVQPVRNAKEILSNKMVVRPARNAKKNLLDKIDVMLNRQLGVDAPYLSILNKINQLLYSWGKAYSFCNDLVYFNNIDQEVEARLEKLDKQYSSLMRANNGNKKMKRRIQGVNLLFDVISKEVNGRGSTPKIVDAAGQFLL